MTDTKWVHTSSAGLFEKLSHKLASLVYTKTDGDRKALKEILQELNSLDFDRPCLKSNERGVLMINHCCCLIPPQDEHLILLACELLENLLTKQHLLIESKTLSLAVSWCLQCLKYKINITLLKCLQLLVKGNNSLIEHQLPIILKDLKRISNNFDTSENQSTDFELVLHCLKCIQNIVKPSEKSEPRDLLCDPLNSLNECFEIFREFLISARNEKATGNINLCNCIIAAMKGIGNLIDLSDYYIDNYMNDILGIVKGFMMYGLPGDDCYKIQKVLPCQVSIPDVFKYNNETKKLKGKYDKKAKKIQVTSITSIEENENTVGRVSTGFGDKIQDGPNFNSFKTSDSDYSEDELSQNSKIRQQESKVRQCALILLGLTVRRTNPKIFAGYLPNFLPDGSQILHVRTLITCLLKDSSPGCRADVVGILTMLISNSKQYFLQADNLIRTSFTTFSSTIGNIIKELHRTLALALVAENSIVVINRLLKCMCELIRSSPYRKLEPGMITRLSEHVRPFMTHRDINVEVSALSVFGCIVSVGSQLHEIRNIIMNPTIVKETEDVNQDEVHDEIGDENLTKSWLFELCLKNITGPEATNPDLTIEALEVIGALVRNFFQEIVYSYTKDIIDALETCLKKPEYLIRLYGGKLMETVLNSLQFNLTLEDESQRPSLSLVSQLWETLLPGPITCLIQSDNEPMLRCTGCDCLANVGVLVHKGQQSSQNSFIFDLIPGKHQILCVTLLFGCVLDEFPIVRSSAIRALAILVLFPSLMEDDLFVLDAADAAIETASDDNGNVRYQSAWLLGNLTEAIVRSSEKQSGDDMSQKVLAKLLETGIRLAQDNPKTRPGALRAIGNIMRTVDENFTINHKHSILEGLNALFKNATTGNFMKARWNACYAIANCLKNVFIYKYSDVIKRMFDGLINLVQNYKNFKVRISAACALCAPPNRECFGDEYIGVWLSVLQALENSKNVCDINEYQHRDQLVDQLCFVIAGLITIMEINDLIPVQDVLVHHLDNVKCCMMKFQQSVVPERGNIILKATIHIHNFLEKCLTSEQKSAINMFESILSMDGW